MFKERQNIHFQDRLSALAKMSMGEKLLVGFSEIMVNFMTIQSTRTRLRIFTDVNIYMNEYINLFYKIASPSQQVTSRHCQTFVTVQRILLQFLFPQFSVYFESSIKLLLMRNADQKVFGRSILRIKYRESLPITSRMNMKK